MTETKPKVFILHPPGLPPMFAIMREGETPEVIRVERLAATPFRESEMKKRTTGRTKKRDRNGRGGW